METNSATNSESLTVGPITLRDRFVYIGDRGASLGPRLTELLYWFMRHPNQIWRSSAIQLAVWGPGYHNHIVPVTVMWLRRKIEVDPENPQILRSVGSGTYTGYCLVTDPEYAAYLDRNNNFRGGKK